MSLKGILRSWFERYLSDEEAIVLLALLVGGFAIVIWLGEALAPFFTALVVAFLLQGVVAWLERRGLPRLLAVGLVFLLFVGALLALALIVMPLVWNQLVELVQEAPSMFASSQAWLDDLQAQYPTVVTPDQVQDWIATAGRQASQLGQRALTFSLASLGNLMAVIIYLVLVPILVFFMLKDRERLVDFLLSLLPRNRRLMTRIWQEMDDQIANYVRGKTIEISIVGSVAFITFWAFGLPYAALLGLMVGLSVLVPYIGAAVATLPVAAVAGFHFGMGEQFLYVLVAYAILQALDGNVLVPILFSEAVNLHPVSIILAVLFFGGLWGFWGVFFAIPLATLIKALVQAWPRGVSSQAEQASP
ncbi:AI-2E family transporter [Salinicola avicenniae]|uniref:AI-2E family transporter n=1 Tax=Salinicola avicenniae TaxID=2916836 RepID=UPI0020732BDB|nr:MULTISPECIES: AI-2E family transporter [unclassified Salinicola]